MFDRKPDELDDISNTLLDFSLLIKNISLNRLQRVNTGSDNIDIGKSKKSFQ